MATRVKKLRIEELSGVDRPANQEGMMVLMKRYQDRGTAVIKALAEKLGLTSILKDDEGAESEDELTDDELDEIEAELDAEIADEGGSTEDDEVEVGKADFSDDELDEIESELDAEEAALDEPIDEPIGKGKMCKGCGKKPIMKSGGGLCDDCAGKMSKALAEDAKAIEVVMEVLKGSNTTPPKEEAHVNNATAVEAVVKSLTPAQREVFAAITKRAADAEGKVAKAESTASDAIKQVEELTKKVGEIVEKSETSERLTLAKSLIPAGAPVTAEEVAVLLKANGDNEAGRKVVEKMLTTMGKLAEGSTLFKSVGGNSAASVMGDSSSESAAITAINKVATEIRGASPKLTREQAVAEALNANPELYDAYMAAQG